MAEFFMTKHGYEEAKARLKYLQTTKRDEIVKRIAEARSHGDLSENAEYDAARNEQAANEGEILELDYQIKNAVVIAGPMDKSVVQIGAKVKVYDPDMKNTKCTKLRVRRKRSRWKIKFLTNRPSAKRFLARKWATW